MEFKPVIFFSAINEPHTKLEEATMASSVFSSAPFLCKFSSNVQCLKIQFQFYSIDFTLWIFEFRSISILNRRRFQFVDVCRNRFHAIVSLWLRWRIGLLETMDSFPKKKWIRFLEKQNASKTPRTWVKRNTKPQV